ncbi:oligosaccharide flippase family protein [Aestuariibacter halophilus]|uniref:Oligosaccharide flippase family protein n=1 Tax=Fluctibacter halophilus TaxID=226011 RepID=A0ABS8G2R1_9ALTE|nr:oligosaccharide flippase family protein [Aestuariibacter halophilus]MCC2614864.1 oligosaccharide flippase family protein [Aestuariibacter halophilus]
MTSVKTSLSWTFASNYLNMFIRFFAVAITARLLTPDEIGIFSIALAGFGFIQIFRDFGIGSYIVQKKTLSSDDLGAAFTVSICICWFLAAVTLLFSKALGTFYGREEVTVIFQLLAINLVIIPFGTINLSLLKRKLKFKNVAIIEVCSAIVGSGSVIVFAYMGYSYKSLAFGSIAGCLATVVVSNIFRQPELPFLPGFKGVKSVLKFGSILSTSNIMTQIDEAGPELIIGKVSGMESVAFFNKGYSTANLFDRFIFKAVRSISGAYFAAYNRENLNRLRTAFMQMQDYIVVVSWPFFIFLGFYADESIRLLYGDQWAVSAALLPYCCFFIAINSVFALFDQLLINTGHVKKQLGIVNKVMLLKLAIVLYAAHQSLELLVMLLMIVPLVRILILKSALRDVLELELSAYSSHLKIWALLSGGFFTALYGIHTLLVSGGLSGIPLLLCAGVLMAVVWVTLVMALRHPLRDELNGIFRKLLKR